VLLDSGLGGVVNVSVSAETALAELQAAEGPGRRPDQ
jgi:hypothetical protein